MYSEVCSHKSVIYPVLIYGIIIEIVKGITISVTNYYGALITQFVPDNVYIDAGIIKILANNPLIKFHPKINTLNHSISNVTAQKSNKSIPKFP